MLGSWHTELGTYAGLRSVLAPICRGARTWRSRSSTASAGMSSRRARRATNPSLRLGVERAAIGRWGRGVDTSRFDPALRDAGSYPGEIKVLYVGRLTREKGVDLLAESFLRAHEARPEAPPAARGRRPGGGRAPRAARRPRHASSAGSSGDDLATGLRERRHLPVLQPDRHLRPGPGRGRAPAGSRAWRSTRAAPHRSWSTARPDGSANPTPTCSPPRSAQLADSPGWRAKLGRQGSRRRPRTHLGGRRWSSSRTATTGSPSRQIGLASSSSERLERPSKVSGVTDELAQRDQRIQRAGRGRRRDGRARARCAPAPPRLTSPTPRSTSTASSPGSTSTTGCSSWPRTRGSRCSSGSTSARSTTTTWTSSSWCASPASTTRSSRDRRARRRRDGGRRAASTRSGSGRSSCDARLCRCFADELRPALAEHGIRIISLDDGQRGGARGARRTLFTSQVFPALTPLVIGLGRPFPYISNLSLSLGRAAPRPRERRPRSSPGSRCRRSCSAASSRSATTG